MQKPRIAFIGLGNMGSGMVKRLLEAGYTISVFNRTISKSDVIGKLGAQIAVTPKDAVQDVDFLITMVSDDQALGEIMFGPLGVLNGMKAGATHISMSTISENLAEKLTDEHRKTKTHHVGAPVFGRPPAAASGKLFILAGGSEDDIKKCQSIFEVLGQKYITVGKQPKEAHLTKILGNFMLFSAVETMAEAIAQAKVSGLNERLFLDAMTSTIFSAPFYANYGTMMVEQNYPTSNSVSFQLALKDVRLAIESSADRNHKIPAANFLEQRLLDGIANGYEKNDVSALVALASLQKTEKN